MLLSSTVRRVGKTGTQWNDLNAADLTFDLCVTPHELSAPSRPTDEFTFNELKDAHWLFDTPGIMKEHDVSLIHLINNQ